MAEKQQRILSCLILMLTLVLTMSSAISAASDSDFSVRAAGMGGAYTALSSGVSGLLYNPAGIGLRAFELTLNFSAPGVEDLQALQLLASEFNDENYDALPDYIDAATLLGLNVGPLAVAAKARVNATIVEGTTSDTVTVTAMPEVAGGLGFYLFRAPLGVASLRVGASGHYYQGNVSVYQVQDGEVVSETTASGEGQYFSLGALATITPWITVGFSARDLASSFAFDDAAPIEGEPVYTLGAAVKLPIPMIGITVAADADSNDELRFGAEVNLLANLISLRAGQIQIPDQDPITTAGMSINFGPLTAGLAAQTIPGGKLNQEEIDRIVMEGTFRF